MRKLKNTEQLNEEILAPIIKWCAENRGGLTKLAEKFNQGLSESVRMSTIARWLTKDRSKAVPPNAGSFLRLAEAWKELRGPSAVNISEPEIYCSVNGHESKRNISECRKCGAKL